MKKTISLFLLALVSLIVILIFKTSSPGAEHVLPLSATPSTTFLAKKAEETLAPTTSPAAGAGGAESISGSDLGTGNGTASGSGPSSDSAAPTTDSTTSSASSPPVAAPTPTEHHFQIKGITPLSQLPELPNGCEAVAATMLLNWAGLPLTKAEVAEALPKGDMPYENEDGAFIGSNPKDVFVGDPFDVGYGIYHTPVAKMMNQWLPGHIRDLTGSSFDDLLGVIAHGSPAMIWATEHMDTPYLDLEWEDESGELVPWYQPEHALLLTGWDDDFAYMNDPMTGEQETYSLTGFKEAWELMGSQAIMIIS
jgi:uncharacterized protein YvpB